MPRRGITLTDDQWRTVKSHAAKRGQTISEFFADLLRDIGMDGHVRPATTAAAVARAGSVEADMATDHLVHRPTERAAAIETLSAPRPAPKPGGKKR